MDTNVHWQLYIAVCEYGFGIRYDSRLAKCDYDDARVFVRIQNDCRRSTCCIERTEHGEWPSGGFLGLSPNFKSPKERNEHMKILTLLWMMVSISCFGGSVFVYQYDVQHRLVAVDYSEAQTDAHVSYQYDAANNLDLEVSITDGAHLKSFLLWFALSHPDSPTLHWLDVFEG